MRPLALFALSLALAGSASAQSLGVSGKHSFAAIEAPCYKVKAFHFPDWSIGLNAFGASQLSGGKGLGLGLSLEHRFYTWRIFGVPVVSAYWHVELGAAVFQQERPGRAEILGLEFR